MNPGPFLFVAILWLTIRVYERRPTAIGLLPHFLSSIVNLQFRHQLTFYIR